MSTIFKTIMMVLVGLAISFTFAVPRLPAEEVTGTDKKADSADIGDKKDNSQKTDVTSVYQPTESGHVGAEKGKSPALTAPAESGEHEYKPSEDGVGEKKIRM